MARSQEETPDGFASPPCMLHEVEQAYADPKLGEPELLSALAELHAAERRLAVGASSAMLATSDPRLLTFFEKVGRCAVRNAGLLRSWIERLGGSAEEPRAEPAPASVEERATEMVHRIDTILGQLNRLTPRVSEPLLHAKLLEARDQWGSVQAQSIPRATAERKVVQP